MFNLIIKDILIQKKMLAFVLIYCLVLILAFQQPPFSTVLYYLITTALVYILVVTAAAYDERSALVLSSLPVSRREIVLAKYCSVFVYAAIGLLAAGLIAAIVPGLGLRITVRPLTTWDLAGSLAGTIIFCSYYFPVYFKLGNIRIRYINMGLFMLMFFLPGMLADYFKSHQIVGLLLTTFRQTPPWWLWPAISAVLLALLLLSLIISLRIYEHRDL